MPWHVTLIENAQSILKDGLLPRIGPRSVQCEKDPMVHLFTTIDDVFDAGWLSDEFEEEDRICLFFVSEKPVMEGAWQEYSAKIPADKIHLVISDLDNAMMPSHLELYRAMDRVEDPIGNLDDFRQAAIEMSAYDYGLLVGDGSFDEPKRMLRAYPGGFYIEPVEDGRHLLTIENRSWLTGEEETLADLEERLFTWVREEFLNEPKAYGPAI